MGVEVLRIGGAGIRIQLTGGGAEEDAERRQDVERPVDALQIVIEAAGVPIGDRGLGLDANEGALPLQCRIPGGAVDVAHPGLEAGRSEEQTYELQSLMRNL